jgi:hypothetical protein
MTMNHIDFISSAIQAVCKLCHTFGQLVVGCSVVTLTSLSLLAAVVMVWRVMYRRLRNALGDSSFSGGVT